MKSTLNGKALCVYLSPPYKSISYPAAQDKPKEIWTRGLGAGRKPVWENCLKERERERERERSGGRETLRQNRSREGERDPGQHCRCCVLNGVKLRLGTHLVEGLHQVPQRAAARSFMQRAGNTACFNSVFNSSCASALWCLLPVPFPLLHFRLRIAQR